MSFDDPRDPKQGAPDEPGIRVLTRGDETRNILSLALPSMATMLLQTTFNLVDIFWVGMLGSEALAAVSVSAFLIWAMFSLTEALSVGVNALVGRRIGGADRSGADIVAWQGLAWGLLAGVAVALVGRPFLPSLFRLMRTEPAVAAQGEGYAGLLYAAAPLVFSFFVLEAAFRGRGDAMTPLRILGLSLVLNLFLDPLLILGLGPIPALGVRGAAVATILSRGAGVALGIWLLRGTIGRGMRARFLPSISLARRMVRIGAPVAAAGFFFCVVYVVLARIVGRFGTAPLAALGVGHKVESLSYLTCVGFGAATSTLVAQNLGADRPDRADRLVGRSLRILTGFELVYTTVLLVFARPIVEIFSDDPEVLAHGAHYLRIVALSQVFMGWEIVHASAFGGAGSTLPSIAITFPLTVLRIPLAWALAVALGWGPTGVWVAISSSTVATGLALTAWWRRGGWRSYEPDPTG